ncbi:MAG TPA: ABC transporter permease, partial [Acidobacteriota bacterium]
MNRQIFTIAGVAPQSFHGTFAGVFPALWVPLVQTQGWLGPDWRTDRNVLRLHVIGRLAAGVNINEARAAIQTVARRLQNTFPDTNRERGADVEEARLLPGGLRGMVAVFLSLFLLIVGLVLLTVCANLGNFVFIRTLARRREFSLRLALGAGRIHLLRKTFAESLILSFAGGSAGLILAGWCSKLLLRFNPIPSVPLRFDFTFDHRVYLFTLLACVVSAFILTLPALSLLRSTNPAENLKQEAGSLSAGQSKVRLRKFFVTVQVAFSLLLLIGASLFLQSLQNAQSMDLGFDPENALAVDLDLNTQGYSEESGKNFYEQLIRRVEALPGVVSASLSDLAPIDLATQRTAVMIGKQAGDPAVPISISMNRIHLRYFQTIRMNLQSGRDFAATDHSSGQSVAIINEHMAKRFWPNQNPIDQTFQVMIREKINVPVAVRIVGVAKNGKYRTLGEPLQSHFYLPFLQNYHPGMTLLVRTAGEPLVMMDVLQREIQDLNPN